MHTLTGVIERITYHNEENGYTVAKLTAERGGGLVTTERRMVQQEFRGSDRHECRDTACSTTLWKFRN